MARYGIVVLNYQKYEMTEKCVSNLLELATDAEILIVDNASTNDSYKYLSELYKNDKNVEVILNSSNAGYARGNNFGFKYMFERHNDIKYCCVMNPDVEICYREIFDNLIAKLELNHNYAIATGLMVTNGYLNINSCFWSIPLGKEIALGHSVLHKNINRPLSICHNGIAEVEVLPGSFFMIKRSIYESLGGFDEGTFLYNEENILAIQLKKMGYKNILSISDYYNHNHPKGARKSLVQKIKSSRIGNTSRRYLCRKYYPKKYDVLLSIVILSNVVVIATKHFVGNIILLFTKR